MNFAFSNLVLSVVIKMIIKKVLKVKKKLIITAIHNDLKVTHYLLDITIKIHAHPTSVFPLEQTI